MLWVKKAIERKIEGTEVRKNKFIGHKLEMVSFSSKAKKRDS
jgi:hypothetical protein